jgi:DNA polymerase III psi subunit
MNNQQLPVTVYQVRVGHSEVIVKASSSKEAIVVARRQLALEMPLLYDIIRALDVTRFKVLEAA